MATGQSEPSAADRRRRIRAGAELSTPRQDGLGDTPVHDQSQPSRAQLEQRWGGQFRSVGDPQVLPQMFF